MIAPTIVSIIDATAQLESGGKKDATFVAHYMKEVVSKYDPNLLFTDVFFFDRASNVQKGGKILEKEYPRAYALHMGVNMLCLSSSVI